MALWFLLLLLLLPPSSTSSSSIVTGSSASVVKTQNTQASPAFQVEQGTKTGALF